jgi:signal transduction histidine kinase
MQSEVFQIFAQVDEHIEYAAGGLGIGLALVRQLVGIHGGSIAVRSEGQGKGSTFAISIPLSVDRPRLSSGLPSASAREI